ncbi:MAG TPA: tryptophan-rich sensory protein [Anaerolineaceae bacterium]|nr:tryptophan-rich sensory protein [Anaerolineaceae bacterium]
MKLRTILNLLTLLLTLVVNSLANILPLNGMNTGQISDSLPSLFTPAGYVFSIWSIIYIGLIAFGIYQALPSQRNNPRIERMGWWFVIANLFNSAWIFAWHYLQFGLSVVLMLGLLVSLLVIYERIGRRAASRVETWTVNVPFSIYLGWITVATVANIASLLISLGWNGFGIPVVLTVAMIGIATLLGVLMILLKREIAYPLVLIWAFAGIAAVRADVPLVEIGAIVAAALLLLVMLARIGIGLKQRAKA